jgi:hypothetical protein
MELSTFKCVECDWVGTKPARYGVNSGHSSQPVRYYCPDCLMIRWKRCLFNVNHFVVNKEYYAIDDPEYLFEGSELLTMLNIPRQCASALLGFGHLTMTKRPTKDDPSKHDYGYLKKEVDALIKSVNG